MLLYENTNIAAAENGQWKQLQRDERAYRPLLITVTGTATVVVEGRNQVGDTAITLKQVTATEGFMVGAFPQMRVRITSVTAGASVRVSIDGTVRTVV